MAKGASIGAAGTLRAKLVLVGMLIAACGAAAAEQPPQSSRDPLAIHRELARRDRLKACAAADLDCRAFTGTLEWRPDERRPLLSSRGLRQLRLLRRMGLGQRERALRCLALVAWAEARSEGVTGMRAVVAVVLNRSRDPAFPSHPCEVVSASHAFEPMVHLSHGQAAASIRGRRLVPFPRPTHPLDVAALQMARLLVWNAAQSASVDDPTFGATHFLAPAVLRARGQAMPHWATVYQPTARIGEHHFYRRPLLLAGRE